jgi:hypothetical protein
VAVIVAAIALACRLTTRGAVTPDFAFSRPMEDMGVVWRRYQWHAAKAAASTAVTFTLREGLHVRPRRAAIVATLLVGVVPHVVGVLRCAYPYDPADWTADAVIASVPVFFVGARTRVQFVVRVMSYGASYGLTAPFASP